MENVKLRKLGRTILAFLSTCCLIIMFWILVDCFTAKSTASEKVISYKVSDSIDYKITMKNNQFYTSEEANESNFYVTSLMDTMQVNFKYNLIGSDYFNSDYEYVVVLNMTSANDGEVVWSYEEDVLSQVKDSVTDVMEIEISDSFNVDLSVLYKKAKEFYDLTGYGVNLDIKVKIASELSVENYDNKISDKQVLSISIPLSEKVASITKSSDNSVNKKVIDQYEVDEEFNTYLFIVSIGLIAALTPVTVRSYVALFNLTNLDNYDRKLKRLKTRYGFISKEVTKAPNFDNKEIYEVLSCSELSILCANKDLNINVYEKRKGKECWFYVVDKKDVYMYVLALDYEQIKMSNKGSIKLNKNKKKK